MPACHPLVLHERRTQLCRHGPPSGQKPVGRLGRRCRPTKAEQRSTTNTRGSSSVPRRKTKDSTDSKAGAPSRGGKVKVRWDGVHEAEEHFIIAKRAPSLPPSPAVEGSDETVRRDLPPVRCRLNKVHQEGKLVRDRAAGVGSGLEAGSVYARLGDEVTVVEYSWDAITTAAMDGRKCKGNFIRILKKSKVVKLCHGAGSAGHQKRAKQAKVNLQKNAARMTGETPRLDRDVVRCRTGRQAVPRTGWALKVGASRLTKRGPDRG